MKIINFVFTIAMIISLMVIINANERKQRSTNLFRDRLLELLLESKRREVLLNQYKKEIRTSDHKQSNNEDHYGRTFARRKVVGISDNPF